MTIHTGDCVEVMAGMEPASVDAIVTDPPYGLEFMGKDWDDLAGVDRRQPGDPTFHPSGVGPFDRAKVRYGYGPNTGIRQQEWHHRWATEAFRVAKPGAYLLAFGGTRTYHRMTCAIEDAGWIIRDCLVWAYASGFPKSKALLKPAWEPIVMARKPGPLRELAIDACRIGLAPGETPEMLGGGTFGGTFGNGKPAADAGSPLGRWPANLILTDPIFDGDTPGVVGAEPEYSRFFCVSKADRAEREPVLGGLPLRANADWPQAMDPGAARGAAPRANVHPTVKPLDLMCHLVRLVTPQGGVVLDPFLGSGTTALAAEMEGFAWVGIEKEPEYVAIAEARLNGTQRGLGLPV